MDGWIIFVTFVDQVPSYDFDFCVVSFIVRMLFSSQLFKDAHSDFLIQRIDASLKKAVPWLVLAGSGPAADLISELLDNLFSVALSPTSPPADGEAAEVLSTELRDWVHDKVRRHFPAEAELEKLINRVSQTTHVLVCVCLFVSRVTKWAVLYLISAGVTILKEAVMEFWD